jgi:hypothetical protein
MMMGEGRLSIDRRQSDAVLIGHPAIGNRQSAIGHQPWA